MSDNVNVSQRTMTARIEAAEFDKQYSRGEATDRARLLAYSAPWSDEWLKVVPNDVVDTHTLVQSRFPRYGCAAIALAAGR